MSVIERKTRHQRTFERDSGGSKPYSLVATNSCGTRITLEDFEYLRPVALDFISAYIKKGYRWRGVYSLNEKFNLYIQEFSFCTEIECFSADFYEYLKLANFEVKREKNGTFVAKVIFTKKRGDR
jgi:hypothetical protein